LEADIANPRSSEPNVRQTLKNTWTLPPDGAGRQAGNSRDSQWQINQI